MTMMWETPRIETVCQNELANVILTTACSKFFDECPNAYILSTPPVGGDTI